MKSAEEVRAKLARDPRWAYADNPARFCHRRPTSPKLPTAAWINEPTIETTLKRNPDRSSQMLDRFRRPTQE